MYVKKNKGGGGRWRRLKKNSQPEKKLPICHIDVSN